MKKDKIVTYEMFKEYHKNLMKLIKGGDGFELNIDEEDDDNLDDHNDDIYEE